MEDNSVFVRYEDVRDVSVEDYFRGSQLSISSFKNKYLVEECNDKTPADVFWRVADYASISESDNVKKEYWRRRWFHEMWNGMWMPGGSILQGAANPRSISQINCTTLSIEKDNLESIFDTAYKVAKCAARRQGLGTKYNLRPKGAKINNSSNESLGNPHWMKFIDGIGNYVGQKGRIPAMLFSIPDSNPDLIDFITVKSDQKTISNANISVQWSDAFMRCLEEDGVWKMEYVVEDTGEHIVKEEKASIIFDAFVNNNWRWAEPGAQYIDVARYYSNSDYLKDARWSIVGTNACSEQYLEYQSGKSAGVCFLASVNFMYLYRTFGNSIDDASSFLRQTVAPSIHRLLDNLITREIDDKRYAIEEQRHSLENLRRMGVGITNLDGYLIYNGIGYDTDEGIDAIFKLTDELNAGLYESSIAMGKERGSFLAFNREDYIKAPFVSQMMDRHGLKFETMRNVCLSSVAPSGTISTMFTDFVSYGIEPILGLYYWKRHRTSGKWQWVFCVQPFVIEIMKQGGIDIGMPSSSIDDDDNGSVGEKIAAIIDEHFPKDKFKPAHMIDPFKKVELMSRLTKHCIDSSISVTYNLPEDVSHDTIKQLYIQAWKKKVKSIAIYRDKSRQAVAEFESPRIVNKRYIEQENTERKISAKQRPIDLPCDVHHITVKGEKWIAFVGLDADDTTQPYEIFAGKEEEISLPKKYKTGITHKNGGGKYHFISGDGDDQIKVSITDSFKNDENSALTRHISLGMRFGVPLAETIQQLMRSHGTVVDFSKVLMRVLKTYLKPEEAIGTIKCQDCGSKNLSYQEKCFVCLDCGSSKCG